MAVEPQRGGFKRPRVFIGGTETKGIGQFIRAYLMQRGETWGYDIYQAYKQAVQSIPSPTQLKTAAKKARAAHRTLQIGRPKAEKIPITPEELSSRINDYIASHGLHPKRKVISYEGFRSYLYILRRLGLIENVLSASGEVTGEQAGKGKTGDYAPFLAKTRLIKLVDSTSPAWDDPWKYYRALL